MSAQPEFGNVVLAAERIEYNLIVLCNLGRHVPGEVGNIRACRRPVQQKLTLPFQTRTE